MQLQKKNGIIKYRTSQEYKLIKENYSTQIFSEIPASMNRFRLVAKSVRHRRLSRGNKYFFHIREVNSTTTLDYI